MESSSIPLAEYFWIAGVESFSYEDANFTASTGAAASPVEATISEDGQPVNGNNANGSHKNPARHSRQNSANRLSKLSLDMRSISSAFDEIDAGTKSNRSSTTIKAVNGQTNGASSSAEEEAKVPEPGTKDFDFDKALYKFASEREYFLEDLSFSAGAKLQQRPPMVNARAERIKADEGVPSGRLSPLRSITGSLRRKISFRDSGSIRKAPNRPAGPPKAGKTNP